jgi:ABC-type lipoprotein export system ATPase subunit
MKINSISILGGIGKDQSPDLVGKVQFEMGQIVSIVGPTGSGKTTLINDLELFADRNTPYNEKF